MGLECARKRRKRLRQESYKRWPSRSCPDSSAFPFSSSRTFTTTPSTPLSKNVESHRYRFGYHLLVSDPSNFIRRADVLTIIFLRRCVGVWQNDRVEIIANDQGNRTTPSYVSFSDTERLIGDAAKNQVAMNPHNTVFDAKRLIGRKFEDPEVQSDMKHFSFKVINKAGKPYIEVEYRGETKQFVSFFDPLFVLN